MSDISGLLSPRDDVCAPSSPVPGPGFVENDCPQVAVVDVMLPIEVDAMQQFAMTADSADECDVVALSFAFSAMLHELLGNDICRRYVLGLRSRCTYVDVHCLD